MRADCFVHFWLGDCWLIAFVMPSTSIANDINDDILLKSHSIVERHLGHKQNGNWVITVYMEDWGLHHFCDFRAITRRPSVLTFTNGVTDLIINNNVQRPTRIKASGLRHLKGLHDNPLTRKGCITMNVDGKHLVTDRVPAPVHSSANRSCDNGCRDLKMARIKSKRQVHFATGRHQVRGEPLMIFNVA